MNQAMNPYLPGWEYIPDGEPYVFEGPCVCVRFPRPVRRAAVLYE